MLASRDHHWKRSGDVRPLWSAGGDLCRDLGGLLRLTQFRFAPIEVSIKVTFDDACSMLTSWAPEAHTRELLRAERPLWRIPGDHLGTGAAGNASATFGQNQWDGRPHPNRHRCAKVEVSSTT